MKSSKPIFASLPEVTLGLYIFIQSYVLGLILNQFRTGYEFVPIVFPYPWFQSYFSSLHISHPPKFDTGDVGLYSARIPWLVFRFILSVEGVLGLVLLFRIVSLRHRIVATIMYILLVAFRMSAAEHMVTADAHFTLFVAVLVLVPSNMIRIGGCCWLLVLSFVITQQLQIGSIVIVLSACVLQLLWNSVKPQSNSAVAKLKSANSTHHSVKKAPMKLEGWFLTAFVVASVVCVPLILLHTSDMQLKPYVKNECTWTVVDKAYPEDTPFERSADQQFDDPVLALRVCRYPAFAQRYGEYLMALAREKIEMEQPELTRLPS
jgi:hypothetical protein